MIVDPDVEAYAEAHTTPQARHLQALAQATREQLTAPEMLSGPVVGRLLELLVWLRRPRLVVEVGTYSGASALAMAAALPPEGRIVTLELDPERAAFARRHIEEAGMDDRVEVRVGPALEALRALDEPVDLAFVDADKTGYPDYYEALVPRLAPGGLLVADNTLRGGRVLDPPADDPGTQAMARFNDRVASDERVVGVVLTVRDGVTLVRPA
ncbi:O-methyltransferase [Conexibacter sp. SYSU D00693]|uniref:O-methyltransferase n=1 Tax=Conexibacter sp. SYSU D00693 TaxID=2812560 RepID=UPI00196B7281|nr:O-methyltransferase [Conexibacter sp. SYSU D00693]